MSEGDTHRIGNALTATISACGAELHSLRTEGGVELLWQAGPQWPRHAPVLFPIVGRLAGDRLTHDGVAHPMTQHGFARDRTFRFVSRATHACRLRLEDDAQSRARYPFAFRLDIDYRIEDATLHVGYTLTNPASILLPAALGAHPAFQWPLDPAFARAAHGIVFERAEPAPIRRVVGGLLAAKAEPTPVRGRALALNEALFENDAVILEAPASRSLRYGVAGGPGLRIEWAGFSQLGLWSKAGAAFLCIEPWSGLASPAGFDGEFRDKPQLMLIAPGETRSLSWSVTPEAMA